MHSDHRHQLQQNELGQLTLKAAPWFEKHGMQLIVGVGVAAAALLIGGIWWSSSQSASTVAWSELALAETVEQFGDVADRYPGSLAGAWANLRSGELNFESGMTAMFRDRELGLKDLQAAREQFDLVLGSSVSLPENLRERAQLGLARTLEAVSDGDTSAAVQAYERVLNQFPNTVHKVQIERRIAELKSGAAQEFYTWFHSQKPEPEAFPRPNDGQKGMTIPSGDPLDLPPAAAPSTTPDAATPNTSPSPAQPAAPEGTSTSTESTPKSETPATPAAPSPASQPE